MIYLLACSLPSPLSLPSIPFLDSSVGNYFMIAGRKRPHIAPPTDEEWNGLREEGRDE